MIASNYRKFPEAMALQLVLVFGRCTWHTARPTQRLARAVRAARAVLVKETPQLVRWVKKTTPDWFKQAKRAARELANQVKAAMAVFVWDLIEEEEKVSRSCPQSQVKALLEGMKKNFGPTTCRHFTWAVEGKGTYQHWISHGQRKLYIKASTTLAYRG